MHGYFPCMYVCVPSACLVPKEARRGHQIWWTGVTEGCVSHLVGTGYWTWVLQPLNHLSSPRKECFKKCFWLAPQVTGGHWSTVFLDFCINAFSWNYLQDRRHRNQKHFQIYYCPLEASAREKISILTASLLHTSLGITSSVSFSDQFSIFPSAKLNYLFSQVLLWSTSATFYLNGWPFLLVSSDLLWSFFVSRHWILPRYDAFPPSAISVCHWLLRDAPIVSLLIVSSLTTGVWKVGTCGRVWTTWWVRTAGRTTGIRERGIQMSIEIPLARLAYRSLMVLFLGTVERM